MRRRVFITTTAAAAAMATAWAHAVRGQQTERVPRVAVLSVQPLGGMVRALQAKFKEQGWTEGADFLIDARFIHRDALRAQAKDVVASNPDVIVARSSPEVAAIKRETDTVPIVFRLRPIRSRAASSPTSRVQAAI